MHRSRAVLPAAIMTLAVASTGRAQWQGFAGDSQHTAISTVESQPLLVVKWVQPLDTASQANLSIHYGSPMITAGNTVIVPMKTSNAAAPFQIEAFDGTTGAVKWTQTTDYTLGQLPPISPLWPYYSAASLSPAYSPTITSDGTMYFAGAGGTIYKRSSLDATGAAATTQLAFYGINNYNADKTDFNNNIVLITTPITADKAGNIYFGFSTDSPILPGLNNGQTFDSGLARISATGVGTYIAADSLKVNGVDQVAYNSAPVLSNDGSTVYALLSDGDSGNGQLTSFNSTTLQPIKSVALLDPKTGQNMSVPNGSTSSPVVGPDGDIYIGLNGSPYRGYMLHYSSDLTVQKPAGAFGSDVTPSVVPADMVPSYHGTSGYLLMVKYNEDDTNQNRIAILDPNATEVDTRSDSKGATVMKVVMSILDPTANPSGGVDAWSFNSAVVDPATDSILVNNADGKLYRWNLITNTLSQVIALSGGSGQTVTPTLVGPDGTVYAINNAVLSAVGLTTSATAWYSAGTGAANWSNTAKWSGAVVPTNGNPVTKWYDVTITSAAVTLDVDANIHSLNLASGSLVGAHNLSFSNAIINGSYQVMGLTTITGAAAFNANSNT